MSRYFNRPKAINNDEMYKRYLKKRGKGSIDQYRTPIYNPVPEGILETFEIYSYIFQVGDAYWKISDAFYGDPKYWWVIASFNRKPTISHIKVGDIIHVPLDLTAALELLE